MQYFLWLCAAIACLAIVLCCRLTARKKKEAVSCAVPEGDYQMVVIINTDLKMSKGKILSQFGHAIDAAHRHLRKHPELERAWRRSGSAKIALRAPGPRLGEIYDRAKDHNVPRHRIIDAGRTQVPCGSNTCIVLGPSTKPDLEPLTGALPLYYYINKHGGQVPLFI